VISKYEEIDGWLRASETTQPDKENRSIYNRFYELYKDVYEANSSVFQRISQIKQG